MSEIKQEPVDPCLPDDATVRPKLEIVDDETVVKTEPETFVKVEEDYCLNDPVCDIYAQMQRLHLMGGQQDRNH